MTFTISGSSPLTMPRLRVLVVEDESAYRRLASEALNGHDKWFAKCAQEAMGLFNLHQPDIVFLDLGLPDDNGLRILLDIRQRAPEAFVVILTASRLGEDVMQAQRCAANGYIIKPFSRKQVHGYCEAYLRHREKMEGFSTEEREAFHQQIREGAAWVESRLRTPVDKAQAALQELMARWSILLVGAQEPQKWKEALASFGCTVACARTGAEAMERVKEQRFRLLIAEDDLPDMDASELLYRLRVNHHSVASLIITNAEWKLEQEKWRQAGAGHVVSGPVSVERFRMLVEREVARNLHEADEIILKA